MGQNDKFKKSPVLLLQDTSNFSSYFICYSKTCAVTLTKSFSSLRFTVMDVFQSYISLSKKTQQQKNSKQIKARLTASLKQGQRSRQSWNTVSSNSSGSGDRRGWIGILLRETVISRFLYSQQGFYFLFSIHPFPSSWMYDGGNTQIIWKWRTEKDNGSTHALGGAGGKTTIKSFFHQDHRILTHSPRCFFSTSSSQKSR